MSRRPEFLTSPGVWVRTGSRVTDAARDACAIERTHVPTTDRVLGVVMAVVIGVLSAVALVHWMAA